MTPPAPAAVALPAIAALPAVVVAAEVVMPLAAAAQPPPSPVMLPTAQPQAPARPSVGGVHHYGSVIRGGGVAQRGCGGVRLHQARYLPPSLFNMTLDVMQEFREKLDMVICLLTSYRYDG